ncbi:uncharacterized protein At3g49140-like isoform X3 [Selaginella moellendorffii]|uniref:uncharacterized protein At3g49140-like isoform X3 n=1 Tax=Selaginella moellendorffii TaxID=88036 RepID=UPI000D1C76DC|nr:uncharacterized protein At3g49140-like isoform X3 [Selaginella moellendorffii]|eukprot:XP_024521736.1 uncharacterized protein At3g49140-like isoform X3 [Selaginella moellendorffii]
MAATAAALVCIGGAAVCCGSRIAAVKKCYCYSSSSNSNGSRGQHRATVWCCNAAAAANNSDSRPDVWKSGNGFHPLEELSSGEKEQLERVRTSKLNDGEIARTIAEVNSNAILLAPALSQSNAVYGTEVMFVVDEHGDIYFELADDNDVLHNLAVNPQCSFIIGFGELNELLTTELLPTYENHLADDPATLQVDVEAFVEDDSSQDEISSQDGDISESEDVSDTCDMPLGVHPMVFASKLAKVTSLDPVSGIFKPSMRLAMTGVVSSVTEEEAASARKMWEERFLWEDDDESSGDEEETQEASSSESEEEEWSDSSESETSLYKFQIQSIQLASDIGAHASVDVKEFRYSEADVLAHAAPDIIKRLNSGGKKVKRALKSLCHREHGVDFEEVVVIGVDSLGVDVRACRGIELKTMRFAFARRARCIDTAQLLLHQLLYPRSRHKK